MIKRIELKNFMSHKKSVIEPAEGLTVIVGENNSGKSAIVDALQVLCGNVKGDYMVRHGEKECSVKVETSENDVVEWKRKGTTVSYNINGKDIHRLGGSVPDELHEILRMPKVETEGGDPFDVHFGEQKNPIFLLNESAGRRALFFASSSDAVKLIEMQRLHKKNIQNAKWEETRLIKDEAEYKSRILKLLPVEKTKENLEHIEKDYKTLCDGFIFIEDLKNNIIKIEKAKKVGLEWENIKKALAPLLKPPLLKDIKPFIKLINSIEKEKKDIENNLKTETVLKMLETPPSLTDTKHLENSIIEFKKIEEKEIKYNENIKLASDRLEAPPQIKDAAPLKNIIEELRKSYDKIEYLESNVYISNKLAPPPALENASHLRDIIKKIEIMNRNCEKTEQNLNEADKNFVSAKAELDEFIERIGSVCPTCGQKVSSKNFLDIHKGAL